MRTSKFITKFAAAVFSAAILLNGASVLPQYGILSGQNAVTASAWSVNDPNYLGSSVTASIGHNVYMTPGKYLANGNFRAVMQGDGNFVVYQDNVWVGNTTKTVARWSTCTALEGNYKSYKFAIQEDGNLVLYATPKSNGGERWVWATGTNAAKGTYTLKLESNGDLVLYKGGTKHWSRTNDNRVRWHIDLKAQNDPAYRSTYMYPFDGSDIWNVGCGLCSVTMIYNFYKGTNYNPTKLNTGTYLYSTWYNGEYHTNLLNWKAANADDDRSGCTYEKLASRLKDGPVVVYVSNKHFVVVHQCTKSGGTLSAADFKVVDPAYTKANGDHNMTLSESMSRIGGYQLTQIESWGMSRGRKMPNP